MKRLIFHIDVNSAFLSWEAAKRVAAGEADLREIPAAVSGNPETRHGIILAKSVPAKAFGIKTGEPLGSALSKCPHLVLVKPDYTLYETQSAAFIAVCRKYAPCLEQVSVDECFLDMSGTQYIYPDPIATAHQIKNEIQRTLGFTVNVGIGNNKLLAKTASDFEKPNRVHTLFTPEIPEKLWPMAVEDLFSVGKSTAARLIGAGITTVGALAHLDLSLLQNMFGNKAGIRLHEYANGIDNAPVAAAAEKPKGYSNSVTLPENICSAAAAHKVLLALANSVTTRMRADGAKAYSVSVSLRADNFKNKSHQSRLAEATDSTNAVYHITKQLFGELWDGKTPIRLLGIALTQITFDAFVQTTLFDSPETDKARRLDQAVDSIRNRFGMDTITRGSNYRSALSVGKKYKAKNDCKLK